MHFIKTMTVASKISVAILNWKNNVEHMVAGEKGRALWYKKYQLRICKVEHDYGFEK